MTQLLTVRDGRRPRVGCGDLLGRRVVLDENPGIIRLTNECVPEAGRGDGR